MRFSHKVFPQNHAIQFLVSTQPETYFLPIEFFALESKQEERYKPQQDRLIDSCVEKISCIDFSLEIEDWHLKFIG